MMISGDAVLMGPFDSCAVPCSRATTLSATTPRRAPRGLRTQALLASLRLSDVGRFFSRLDLLSVPQLGPLCPFLLLCRHRPQGHHRQHRRRRHVDQAVRIIIRGARVAISRGWRAVCRRRPPAGERSLTRTRTRTPFRSGILPLAPSCPRRTRAATSATCRGTPAQVRQRVIVVGWPGALLAGGLALLLRHLRPLAARGERPFLPQRDEGPPCRVSAAPAPPPHTRHTPLHVAVAP